MNAKAQAVAASLAIGGFIAYKEYQTGQTSLKPFVGAGLAAWATKIAAAVASS